ncbi:MAG: hypothetical protein GH152_04900 [Dehalococcoidia bacterium]|nr:hypothetical protein [Dehalococcoidia bacterium]
MLILPSLLKADFIAYLASPQRFWGLGKVGLITTIVVSVIIIVTFVWIFHGTKKRD